MLITKLYTRTASESASYSKISPTTTIFDPLQGRLCKDMPRKKCVRVYGHLKHKYLQRLVWSNHTCESMSSYISLLWRSRSNISHIAISMEEKFTEIWPVTYALDQFHHTPPCYHISNMANVPQGTLNTTSFQRFMEQRNWKHAYYCW